MGELERFFCGGVIIIPVLIVVTADTFLIDLNFFNLEAKRTYTSSHIFTLILKTKHYYH